MSIENPLENNYNTVNPAIDHFINEAIRPESEGKINLNLENSTPAVKKMFMEIYDSFPYDLRTNGHITIEDWRKKLENYYEGGRIFTPEPELPEKLTALHQQWNTREREEAAEPQNLDMWTYHKSEETEGPAKEDIERAAQDYLAWAKNIDTETITKKYEHLKTAANGTPDDSLKDEYPNWGVKDFKALIDRLPTGDTTN
jgi:hypothetical protein